MSFVFQLRVCDAHSTLIAALRVVLSILSEPRTAAVWSMSGKRAARAQERACEPGGGVDGDPGYYTQYTSFCFLSCTALQMQPFCNRPIWRQSTASVPIDTVLDWYHVRIWLGTWGQGERGLHVLGRSPNRVKRLWERVARV